MDSSLTVFGNSASLLRFRTLLLAVAGVGILALSVIAFSSYGSKGSILRREKTVASQPANQIDGAYRFVSETTAVSAPAQRFEELTDAEWFGIWVFKNGHFSYTRDLINRTEWTPGHFPDNPGGIGFDGASGTYEVRDNTIELKYQTSFYPGRTGILKTLEYKLQPEALTLTEQLAPHTESLATGQRVTVLRKIK